MKRDMQKNNFFGQSLEAIYYALMFVLAYIFNIRPTEHRLNDNGSHNNSCCANHQNKEKEDDEDEKKSESDINTTSSETKEEDASLKDEEEDRQSTGTGEDLSDGKTHYYTVANSSEDLTSALIYPEQEVENIVVRGRRESIDLTFVAQNMEVTVDEGEETEDEEQSDAPTVDAVVDEKEIGDGEVDCPDDQQQLIIPTLNPELAGIVENITNEA